MKKIIVISILFSLMLCGCSDSIDRTDIENTILIRIFGVDKTDDKYKLTILYDATKGGESAEEKYKEANAEGESIYEAFENLNRKIEKKISLSQTKFILLGKKLAESGISSLIEYVSRNQSIKLDSLVYTIKDGDANKMMKSSTEKDNFLGDTLLNLYQKETQINKGVDNSIASISEKASNNSKTILIPCLKEEEEQIFTDGCSVFEDMKRCDTIDNETYLGIGLFLGKANHVPLFLSDGTGLLITEISSKISVKVTDGKVDVKQKTGFATSIKTLAVTDNEVAEFKTDEIVANQNKHIIEIMSMPINYSKKTGRDVLGLEAIISSKDSDGWESIREDWENIIPEINYHIETKSYIEKSVDLER